MKRILLFILLASICQLSFSQRTANNKTVDQTIFVYGGNMNLKFTRYIADLTHKKDPKICFVPTGSADNESNIKLWQFYCKKLNIEPHVLKVWVASDKNNLSFEEQLLGMDAIVVGGGNTLNMLAIWKAQGIDRVLKQALEKGIVLAGGSAGSICWFQSGISDSRPVNLSVVEGLSFLPYSHCPHYTNEERKSLYHQMMKNKKMTWGYACDDRAGILFKNGKAVDFISQSDLHNSYTVKVEKGNVKEHKIVSKYLLSPNSLAENEITSLSVNQKLKELLDMKDKTNPLYAFVSEMKTLRLNKEGVTQEQKDKALNLSVKKTFLYKDELLCVVNDFYKDVYALWYFYKHDGVWKTIGEDFGGKTLFECEISFRERAKMMIKNGKKKFNPSLVHND